MNTKKEAKSAPRANSFSPETKEEALRLVFEEGLTLKETAAKIGCSTASLMQWKAKRQGPKKKKKVKGTRKKTKSAKKKAGYRKALAKSVMKTTETSQVDFDAFVRRYWNDGTRAADVLHLPPEVSPDVVRCINEALRYAYEQFHQ